MVFCSTPGGLEKIDLGETFFGGVNCDLAAEPNIRAENQSILSRPPQTREMGNYRATSSICLMTTQWNG